MERGEFKQEAGANGEGRVVGSERELEAERECRGFPARISTIYHA